MSAATWRVVCEGGEVKRPDVGSVGDGDYVAMTGEPDDEHVGDGTTQRAAVLDLCRAAGWDATELVAPGAQTADERVAQAIVERDAAVAARDALAGAVWGVRRKENAVAEAIGRISGRISDDRNDGPREYMAAVVARDAARDGIDALLTGTPVAMVRADVVREYLAAEDAHGRGDGPAATARTALDAALAAAGGGR